MKTVTRYVSEDGSEWTNEADATARDELIVEVKDIVALLPVIPDRLLAGGDAYYQHLPADVLKVQADLARAYLKRWSDCNGHIEYVVHAQKPAGLTLFGRILDDFDAARPISRAWHRIMCIDDEFREWEQPYYTRNPRLDAVRATVSSAEGQPK